MEVSVGAVERVAAPVGFSERAILVEGEEGGGAEGETDAEGEGSVVLGVVVVDPRRGGMAELAD